MRFASIVQTKVAKLLRTKRATSGYCSASRNCRTLASDDSAADSRNLPCCVPGRRCCCVNARLLIPDSGSRRWTSRHFSRDAVCSSGSSHTRVMRGHGFPYAQHKYPSSTVGFEYQRQHCVQRSLHVSCACGTQVFKPWPLGDKN